jgi:subtilisin family serine protease
LLVIFVLIGAVAVTWLSKISSLQRAQRENWMLATLIANRLPRSGKVVGIADDHVLIGFKENLGETEKENVLTRHGLKRKVDIGAIGVSIVELQREETPTDVVASLNGQERNFIEFAEVDEKISPSFIPNDPGYTNEWHLPQIGAPTAWDLADGSNVLIAIADTGIDPTHPDLMPALVAGWNFYDANADTSDTMGHGTAVAGTAAAVGNNGAGVAGVAYHASIMPLRVGDQNGNAFLSTIASAIAYAADHGARVVNVSYRVGGSATVERAAKYMRGKGGLTVIAEGNSGGLSEFRNSPYIISVSATNNSDSLTSWSTYGKDVDVAAPGQAIMSTARGSATSYWSGTSFSAPVVSGILALMWSVNPNLTPDQVQSALFTSAADLGSPGRDEFYGWGRVDASAAVSAAKNTPATNPGTTTKGKGGGGSR